MNRSLNSKGFTLIELLAVLVILIAIMGIAIPTISSSLERTKEKQNQSRYKIIESNAELFVTDHKNEIYTKLVGGIDKCYIQVSQINYLTNDEMQDANGNSLAGYYVVFTKPNNFDFIENATKGSAVISCI